MHSSFPENSVLEHAEPEHAIELSDMALCVISGKRELRYRDSPVMVNQEKEDRMVFVSFVALPEEAFRLLVRNCSLHDASADISVSGQWLGKWLIAREPKVWHNIACDSIFRFQASYDRQSKMFEPTTIEIRFQHLAKVQGEPNQAFLVPVIARQPSPEDGPGYVPPRDDVMQSRFEVLEDCQSSTFVISFFPPSPLTTFLPLPTPPIASPESGPGSSIKHSTRELPLILLIAASPSSESLESGSASTTGSGSISQMSDVELEEALTEYKDSRLLLPGRLIPGFCGRLTIEEFCRRYELSEEIPSVLTRMNVRDVHSLSRLYLRELRDNELALRAINMLRLAVIRFSSESRP